MSTAAQPDRARLDKYVWPPGWSPTGYPVKCAHDTQDYRGTGSFRNPTTGYKTNCMFLRAGAEGVVKGYTKDRNYFYIAVAPEWSHRDKEKGDLGWIPAGWLNIGLIRKHGNTRIIREGVELVRLNKALKLNVNVDGLDALTSVLAFTFAGMHDAINLLPFIPEGNWQTLKDLGPRGLAKSITAGIKKAAPDYYRRLNGQADWALRDAQKSGRAFTESDSTRALIYSIGYFFEGKAEAQYVGYTGMGPEREEGHDTAMEESNAYHYKYARGYKSNSHRVMCDLGDKSDGEKLGPWAEQALILLTKSQAYFCKYPSVSSISLDALEEDELEIDEEDVIGEDVKNEAVDRRIQARLLIEIFNKACRKVPSFRPNNYTSSVVGLNHESPISRFGIFKKSPWTRVRDPNGMTIYRTRLYNARKTKSQSYDCVIIGGANEDEDNRFRVQYSTDPRPPVNARSAVVVEIKDNGERHPVPYARLSPIGGIRGSAECNAVGIRVEWEENGKTMTMPLQSNTSYQVLADAHGNALRGVQYNLVKIQSLRRCLEQVKLANPQSWMKNYGIARVLDVSFNHLRQEYILKEIFNEDAPITLTKSQIVVDKAEIIQAYRDIGVPRDRIDSTWEVLGQPAIGRLRKTCDRCYALCRIRVVSNIPSVPSGCNHSAGNPCEACRGMGTVCTFTDTDDLKADSRLVEAVTFISPDSRMKPSDFRFVEQIPTSHVKEGK